MFDSHFHIIDPAFPLVENNGFLPEPFTVSDYLSTTADLDITAGAVVSGSFQAFDQGYLLAALTALGPGFVGVTQLPANASAAEIERLDRGGVRAIRFNLARGGSAELSDLKQLARKVYDVAGWHSELYIDARTLDDHLVALLTTLPAVSIDHLGMHRDGLSKVLSLVDKGVKVKATGFGRVELDPIDAMQKILDVNPHSLMFGTDLPSTRARRPFAHSDIDLIRSATTEVEFVAVMGGNAQRWYSHGPR